MTGNIESLPAAWDLTGSVALMIVNDSGSAPVLAGALAEAGADVATAGSSERAVSAAAAAVSAHGRGALKVVGKIDTVRATRDVIKRVLDEFDRLDVLVNAAQVVYAKPFLENSEADWDQVYAANVGAVLRWSQAAGRHMVGQGTGRIVNVISGLAERGLVNSAAYAATQGAVQQITRSLALEWARSGVRVNAIASGWFETERRPLEEQQKELLVRYLPLRRKGHPSDIAALLVYLASEQSGFVTGQTIFVDGGAMAHA